jgi:hypothetical protein
MTWTPRFNDNKLFGPLLTNIPALVARDFRAALNWAGGAALPDIADTNTRSILTTRFPALFIDPKRFRSLESDDGSHVTFEYTIDLLLAIDGPDETQLELDIDTYANALYMLLMSFKASELFAGYKVANGAWTVTEGELGTISSQPSHYTRAVRMTMTAARIEVQTHG